MKGSTYRRCYCRGDDGKPLGKACPQLTSRRHGTWSVRQELPAREDGSRRSFSRSGYGSSKEAREALDQVRALLALPDADDAEGLVRIGDLLEQVSKDKRAPLPDLDATRRRVRAGQSLTRQITVGEWLEDWLASKKKLARTTRSGYESHIRVHLRPRIGHIRLDRLTLTHLVDMFDAIADDNEMIISKNAERREQVARSRYGRNHRPPEPERSRLEAERAKLEEMPPYRKVTGPATCQGIRRTLRAALNSAIAQQHITFNPAAHVELASGRRPKPLLWTDERVARWRETGELPGPVMVWTPVQLGEFLDAAEGDRLYALFHLIAFRGLRRGEAVGQRWTDVDLDQGLLTPAREIVVDNWETYESQPKTAGSASTIGLDSVTTSVLRAHRKRQLQERLQFGAAWQDTGRVFTQADGSWLHPETVSNVFRSIRNVTGLPPITLRDLRHVSATLQHAGGGDLHTIKETLRHSTITLTSDTYTSLLPEVDREVAEKAARLVPRARRSAEE